MIKCQICGKSFTKRGLTYHITHIHNIDKKIYYDTYLKQSNEGKCKYCGNQTKFHGDHYAEYCCSKCACLDKYGVENNLLIPEVKQKAHSKEAHQKAAEPPEARRAAHLPEGGGGGSARDHGDCAAGEKQPEKAPRRPVAGRVSERGAAAVGH